MKYKKILIVGPHSSIASLVMPKLDFDTNSIYAISRNAMFKDLPWLIKENVFISNYPFKEDFMNHVLNKMAVHNSDNVLIINFAGSFGNPFPINDFDIEEVAQVFNENIVQFLSVAKLFSKFPENSFLLGFSGAGVGGDNMDGSSLGYLIAKLSLVGIVEVLDANLTNEKKRIALIAPGPFPSGMQSAVANAPKGAVTEEARSQAISVRTSDVNLSRLADAINWVISKPNESGGRTWSAQRDDFFNKSRSERFGFLRRVIQ